MALDPRGHRSRRHLKFYIRRIKTQRIMSDHEHEGHFPEEAEQNEIGGPVVLTIMILGMVVLILWASC